MRWQIVAFTLLLAAGGRSVQAQGLSDASHDPTVVSALELLGIAREDWPRVEFVTTGRVDGDKALERFAAFRVRRGLQVDPAIYLNPGHPFYREARSGGSDLYPLFRLASVIRHELQHGQSDHAEATALAAQAAYLRRVLFRIPAARRSDALAYIQALELGIRAARQWDASGEYPLVPR